MLIQARLVFWLIRPRSGLPGFRQWLLFAAGFPLTRKRIYSGATASGLHGLPLVGLGICYLMNRRSFDEPGDAVKGIFDCRLAICD